MARWSNRDLSDKWAGHVLHEDWILGENIQFAWREKHYWDDDTEKYEDPVYEIHVRKRRGIFGWGKTDWYLIYREDTFEEICRKLNNIIKQDNEQFWLNYIEDTDKKKEEKKQDKTEEKFCGFGSEGAIGWGY